GAVSEQDSSFISNTSNSFSDKFEFLKSKWSLNFTLMLIFIQLSIQFVLSYFRVYFLTKSGTSASGDLKKDLYSKLITFPMSFYSTQRVGDLSSRVNTDIGQINDTITFVLAEFLRGMLTLIMGLTLIFLISTKLALIMLSVVPVIAVCAVFFGGRIRKMSRKE